MVGCRRWVVFGGVLFFVGWFGCIGYTKYTQQRIHATNTINECQGQRMGLPAAQKPAFVLFVSLRAVRGWLSAVPCRRLWSALLTTRITNSPSFHHLLAHPSPEISNYHQWRKSPTCENRQIGDLPHMTALNRWLLSKQSVLGESLAGRQLWQIYTHGKGRFCPDAGMNKMWVITKNSSFLCTIIYTEHQPRARLVPERRQHGRDTRR